MQNKLPLEIQRFKQIRHEQNLTQAEFAEALGIKNSTADIERGRTKLSGQVVMELLKNFNVNPLWLYGESRQKEIDLYKADTMPKVVTVNPDGQDNISMVNQKAAAGYPHNVQDTEWYQKLPAFDMPLPEYRHATYRGFQVEGDSMLPDFRPDDWVLAKAVENLSLATNNKVYIIVLYDSVLLKKIEKQTDGKTLKLISTNDIYPPYVIETKDIQELWEVSSKLTFSVNEHSENSMLKKLEASMEELKAQLNQVKLNS
ncbi:LexA family transcriptional regulator [Mesohalobacter halotolerans]|uniref:Helix-turn-helix domain-containing protein n=1 Tax=Mesohalobacter halotolerans TaxID=1883405 RepID=A0A4U5TRZ6_9FLAO|nr:LexA family transcriptional regulator [Mesohalobacter halotolerans]MBS3737469.1 helix-turn-helix domain-containing protein [Psychroflexus sp.]TKS57049.1 helix-turn-helix domain-containing protein [Mesohalobacter halotolerans]